MTSKEDKILIKILQQEYGTERLLAVFPKSQQTLATHNFTVKHLQRKIDEIGTVNRQLASGRKRKVIIEQKYSIISVKFC